MLGQAASKLSRTNLTPKKVRHRCVQCQKRFPHAFNQLCDACGGLVEVEYDLCSVRIYDTQNTIERFFDILPIDAPNIFCR